MKIIENTYSGLKIMIIILYIAVILGVWKNAPGYLNIIETVFTIVIALALIYFFNPFVKEKTVCNNFHRKIAFSAGIAILIQTSIFQYLNPIDKIKFNIKNLL